MSVTLRHTLDTSQWSQGLREALQRASDLTPAHRAIGDAVVGWARRNTQTQGARHDWAPLSPATLLIRAAGRSGTAQVWKAGKRELTAHAQKIIGGALALIWSGRLLRSITYEAAAGFVDVGSNLVQAARLWFGSRPGAATFWNGRPTKPTPARNPFELLSEDEAEIVRMYVAHLFGWVQ